jgi:hypothetical protein
LGFRLGTYGGLLVSIGVLVAIDQLKARHRDRLEHPPVMQPVFVDPLRAIGDPQAAVVRVIRAAANRPDAKIEVVRWWPPRKVTSNSRWAECRIIYRLDGGAPPGNRDCTFAIEGDTARLIRDDVESVQSHRDSDRYFPCENCPFVHGTPLEDEQHRLDGAWVVSDVHGNLLGTTADEWIGSRSVIKGDKVTGRRPGSEQAAPRTFTISIDVNSSPRAVNIRVAGQPEALLGIYL